MNINIVKTEKNLLRARPCPPYIVETYRENQKGRNLLKFFLYDPARNSVFEIAPEILKDEKLPVINCIWQSEVIYFASFEGDDGRDIVNLYGYDVNRKKTELITSFENSLSGLSSNDMVRFFILSDAMLIMQTEKMETAGGTEGKGKLIFSQTLFNYLTGEEVAAADPNIVNNGINSIVPISSTHIMMKTGFSYLEDNRLRPGVEQEALIESVFYGPLSQLISSISLEAGNTVFSMLGTAYHENNIFAPRVSGDYIFFSIVDPKESRSETVFYNYKSDETFRAQSLDIESDNLDTACVVDDIPFIRRQLEDETQFINIRTSRVDSTFFGEEYLDACGKAFILERKRGRKHYIRVYTLPKLKLNCEQSGSYVCSCICGEEYFIYFHE